MLSEASEQFRSKLQAWLGNQVRKDLWLEEEPPFDPADVQTLKSKSGDYFVSMSRYAGSFDRNILMLFLKLAGMDSVGPVY